MLLHIDILGLQKHLVYVTNTTNSGQTLLNFSIGQSATPLRFGCVMVQVAHLMDIWIVQMDS